jgi:hypothetical protein
MITVSASKRNLSIAAASAVLVLGILACGTTTKPGHTGLSPQAGGSNPVTPGSGHPVSAAQAACAAGIIPGSTTRTEVTATLGEPVGTVPENGYETLLYASPIPRQYNSVVLQNGVVAYVSIVLGDENPQAWSAVTAQYGQPVYMAYSNYLQGSMTYIYPDKGETFVASLEADAVFIHECYVPVSIQEYMNTWGSTLPTKDPFSG